MRKVYICSPLRGDYEKNIAAARAYCREAVDAGYLPVAPHIYLTQFLDDQKPEERSLGLIIGQQLLEDCAELWVYGEPSEGMKAEIELAKELGIKIIDKSARQRRRES